MRLHIPGPVALIAAITLWGCFDGKDDTGGSNAPVLTQGEGSYGASSAMALAPANPEYVLINLVYEDPDQDLAGGMIRLSWIDPSTSELGFDVELVIEQDAVIYSSSEMCSDYAGYSEISCATPLPLDSNIAAEQPAIDVQAVDSSGLESNVLSIQPTRWDGSSC